MPLKPLRDERRWLLAITAATALVAFTVVCVVWWEPISGLALLGLLGVFFGPPMVFENSSLSMVFRVAYAALWLLSVSVMVLGARYRRRWWGWIVGVAGALALGVIGIVGMGQGH